MHKSSMRQDVQLRRMIIASLQSIDYFHLLSIPASGRRVVQTRLSGRNRISRDNGPRTKRRIVGPLQHRRALLAGRRQRGPGH